MHLLVTISLQLGAAALDLYQLYPPAGPSLRPAPEPGLAIPRLVFGAAQDQVARRRRALDEGPVVAFSLAAISAFLVSLRSPPRPGRPARALAALAIAGEGTEGTFRTVYTASGSDETADDSSDESSDEEDLMEWGQIIDSAKEEEYARFLRDMKAAGEAARTEEAIAELRRTGERIADSLRAAVAGDADHPITKAQGSRGEEKPSGKLRDALARQPKYNCAVIGEGVLIRDSEGRDSATLGGNDLYDPAYLSEQYRKGWCEAVAVRSHAYEDSLGEGALAATAKEQQKGKGDFPGPRPVILREPIVDEIQLAAAKANGAGAVILQLAINGAERTKDLMDEAAEFGLEALVRVATPEELTSVLALEPAIVVIGDCDFDEAQAMLATVPGGKNGIPTVCDLPFSDVRGAWQIRDFGFRALIAGRSMLDICVRDRVPPKATIQAMLSKGSVEYGLGMQKGRLEGSKEYLGTIAM